MAFDLLTSMHNPLLVQIRHAPHQLERCKAALVFGKDTVLVPIPKQIAAHHQRQKHVYMLIGLDNVKNSAHIAVRHAL